MKSVSHQLSNLVSHCVNDLLKILSKCTVGQIIESEAKLALKCDVSRSTLRKSIVYIESIGILTSRNGSSLLTKAPIKKHYLKTIQKVESKSEMFEGFFFESLSKGDLIPGQQFSELNMAKKSGCSTVSVREVLQRLSQFGIIKKNPRQQWQVISYTKHEIWQIADMRKLLELHAFKQFTKLDSKDPLWGELKEILDGHKILKKKKKLTLKSFHPLDEKFHMLLFKATKNELIINNFYMVSMLIHHNLRHQAINEMSLDHGLSAHINIMHALMKKDFKKAKKYFIDHLDVAEKLMLSVKDPKDK